MDRKKLGEALLKTKKISAEQLKYAYAMHDKIGGDFAPLLVKLGYVLDEDITGIMGKLEGIQTVDVTSLVIPKKLVYSIPRDIIEKHNVLPISKKEGQITLAMADINDFEAIEEMQFLTGCRIDPVLASREAIRKAIIQFYTAEEEKEEKIEKKQKSLDEIFDLVKTGKIDMLELQKVLILLLIEKNLISSYELSERIERLANK